MKRFRYQAEFDKDIYMALKDSGSEYKIYIIFRGANPRPLILERIIFPEVSFVFSYYLSARGRVEVVVDHSGKIIGGNEDSKVVVGWNTRLVNV